MTLFVSDYISVAFNKIHLSLLVSMCVSTLNVLTTVFL
jgi:hypothetical protein